MTVVNVPIFSVAAGNGVTVFSGGSFTIAVFVSVGAFVRVGEFVGVTVGVVVTGLYVGTALISCVISVG